MNHPDQPGGTKPDPLTPPDCDQRNFPWIPLDVVRLRDSDLAALESAEAFRAAVLLWCASWHQIPASSVPNDDRILAKLAGYGRDVEAWAKVRDGALHGFIECSDGRLYHPVVAEKALEADAQRTLQKKRTQKATEARRGVKRDEIRSDSSDDHRNDDRDDTRNDVQQTGPDLTGPEKTGYSPKTNQKPVVVAVAGEKTTTTTTELRSASPKRLPGLAATLGTPLLDHWAPDDETRAKVYAAYGMTLDDINAELPGFHAYNLHQGTLSPNWNATFCLWAKQWKERLGARAEARVELNRPAARKPLHEITEAEWDKAAAFYANTGRWMRDHGPDPMSATCRCPKDILAKHEINPDTGERKIPPRKVPA